MIKIRNRGRYFVLPTMLAVLMAACGGGGGGDSGGGGGGPAVVSFTSNQAADVVIGQSLFNTNTTGTTANTITGPYGNPYVDGGKLYLPDSGNSRILVYNNINSIPATDSADFAIGQASGSNNLTDSFSGTTNQLLSSSPQQSMVYNSKLFVADYGNHRIAIYNTVPTSSSVPGTIDVVVGQLDTKSNSSGCDASSLNAPETAVAAGGKLIVTDSANNRVLIWNTIPATMTGAPFAADVVLGQVDMNHCLANHDGGTTADATTLSRPAGVWSDGTRLVVNDTLNNRVLIWNDISNLTDGQAANLVLGQQTDFTGNSANQGNSKPSEYTMSGPYDGVYFNAKQLFVADNGNKRVLIWNSFPTYSGQPADAVLGEPDFKSVNTGLIVNENLMSDPTGVFLSGKQLIVGERNNNRYLIFDGK